MRSFLAFFFYVALLLFSKGVTFVLLKLLTDRDLKATMTNISQMSLRKIRRTFYVNEKNPQEHFLSYKRQVIKLG